jgi:hypothetical protein
VSRSLLSPSGLFGSTMNMEYFLPCETQMFVYWEEVQTVASGQLWPANKPNQCRTVHSSTPRKLGREVARRTCPREALCSKLGLHFLIPGRWIESENSIFLKVIHHRQNPIVTTCTILFWIFHGLPQSLQISWGKLVWNRSRHTLLQAFYFLIQ